MPGPDPNDRTGAFKYFTFAIVCIILSALATFITNAIFQTDTPIIAVGEEEKVSPSEHLSEAKLAMEGYKAGGEGPWGDVKIARTHLEEIKQADPEYSEAQKLLQELDKRDLEIEKSARKLDLETKRQQRIALADRMEKDWLMQGKDFYVTTSGKDHTTIKIKFRWLTRPDVYQLMQNRQFTAPLDAAGFTKLIFTDGRDHTWTYEMDK